MATIKSDSAGKHRVTKQNISEEIISWKKRQIKKNSKKIADKLTGYASVVKELEALGVFSIDPNWRGDIECHMRPENIVKLPFAKSVGFKFSEFDKDHIQASVNSAALLSSL